MFTFTAHMKIKNKGIVCFIVILDTENIWFRENKNEMSRALGHLCAHIG